MKILAIGDCHDSPFLNDKSRFYAMGKLAVKKKVDKVIQIGDFASMDSLSQFDGNQTIKGKRKPTYKQDIESFQAALKELNRGLGKSKIPKHITIGNHEERICRFENNNPEIELMLENNFYDILKEAGWSYTEYGEIHIEGGVGFTHVPFNALGKPFGGMYSHNQVATHFTYDLVYGHSHKFVQATYPRNEKDYRTIINLGCSLPQDHVEHYAKHSRTGWWYGVVLLTLKNNKIWKVEQIPMDELMTYTNGKR